MVVLLGGAAGYVYAASNSKANQQYDVPLEHVAVASDSAALARGRHLTTAIGKCVECHSDDLGGKVMIDDPALGVAIAPNITSGGRLASYSNDELVRVIRHGVKRDGRGAFIMPSDDYQYFSDADVGAIIAYLRSVPAVTRDLGISMLRPVGRTLVATNQLPAYPAARIDHARKSPAMVQEDSSLAYGEYLANVGGCTGCHGPGLGGGPIPGMPPQAPPAANLTPTGISKYSDAQVEAMMRTGKRPDGSEIKPDMPWRFTAMMTPTEMRATIMYLRSVPGKEFGTR
ncbi:MAG TPA: c-type cytochrome [Gemmatimonas sp.]|uniref:c-type cytochrome n=1 Tax=Gemmatimonas sp. TaxID=1962908 RepID=UPI002ED7CF07